MGQNSFFCQRINKPTAFLAVMILLFAVASPAFAHMGSMTKTVAGKVIKLSSFPREEGHRYVVTFTDAGGRALNNWQIELAAQSQTAGNKNETAVFKKINSGEYETVLQFPQEGVWQLTLLLTKDGENLQVEFTDRIVRQPSSPIVLGYNIELQKQPMSFVYV